MGEKNSETWNRETLPLKIIKKMGAELMVLTLDEIDETDAGIQFVNIVDFLTREKI